MKTRFVTLCAMVALAVAMILEGYAVANLSANSAGKGIGGVTQENTNANSNTRSGRRGRRGRRQPPPPPPAADQAAPETAPPQMNPPASTPRGRGQRRGGRGMRMAGVPSGVDNCLKHLAQMAAADPLIDYEGHPSEIINNGLMWNDPKSKCSVGDDQAKRLKIFELSKAWRMKDAATVRSILQELGASSGGK